MSSTDSRKEPTEEGISLSDFEKKHPEFHQEPEDSAELGAPAGEVLRKFLGEPTEEREEPVDPAIFDRPDVQAKIARALKASRKEPTEHTAKTTTEEQVTCWCRHLDSAHGWDAVRDYREQTCEGCAVNRQVVAHSRKEPTEEREGPVDPAIFDRPDVQAKIARALKATRKEPTEEEVWRQEAEEEIERAGDASYFADKVLRLIEALRSSRARVEELEALLKSATQECVTSAQRIEELERAAGEYVEVRRVINENSGSGTKWDHREARRWADKSAAAFEALRQALHHTPKDGTHS